MEREKGMELSWSENNDIVEHIKEQSKRVAKDRENEGKEGENVRGGYKRDKEREKDG